MGSGANFVPHCKSTLYAFYAMRVSKSDYRAESHPMAIRHVAISNSQADASVSISIGDHSRAMAGIDLTWKRLLFFCFIFAGGWMAALAFHYIKGTMMKRGYPYETFLFNPADRHADLINSWIHSKTPNPYFTKGNPAPVTYFPVVYWLLRLGRNLRNEFVVLSYFLIAIGAVSAVWSTWICRVSARWSGDSRWPAVVLLSFGICMLNYPFLMAIDRGCIDPIAMSLMVGALELARRHKYVSGGLLLGLSASGKGFPLVAGLYWLRRGRFRGAALSLLTLVVLEILPCGLYGGVPDCFRGLRQGLRTFHSSYVVGASSAHYSADWLNAYRLIMAWAGAHPDMTRVVHNYMLLTTLWAGALGFFATFVAKSPHRESLAVLLIILVFPSVTNDYKLVFLLPVILDWFSSSLTGWRDWTFGAGAALLMVPKHYYFLPNLGDASISCLVSPLLLVALTAVLWPTEWECIDFVRRGVILYQRVSTIRFL
jgi:hypothetical protein